MQEEGMKILGAVNTVLKSIINIIYDLKEFEIRLSHYTASHSKNKEEADAAMLALKQIWMDNVDVKRGRGSINMLAQDLQFVTVRDAFMMANNLSDIDKLDLNDRVKRILKPRLAEFLEWAKRSETELEKRFEIEKNYLKSQVNSLQLYSRWAKPYLIAAEKLKMKENLTEPALVTVFNTLILQLTLFGKQKIKPDEEAISKNLPQEFRKIKLKRNYYSCVLVDLKFRGIPQRASAQQAHYVFGGKAEVTFKGYCMNDDELALFEEKLKDNDVEGALKLIEGATTDSLEQLKTDIDYFLKSEEEKKGEEKEKSENTNPFSALFSFASKKKKEKKDEKKEKLEVLKKKGVKKDSYQESLVRAIGERNAAEACFNAFDVYKKSHGMESHPSPYD